ncbi:MAG: endolytic transglycosylase MltG [Candidatus Acidiferrales bacterium]|jgi:UPF0755 protein
MRRLGLLLLLGIAAVGAFCAWLDQELSVPYKHYSGESVIVDIPHGTSRWSTAGLLAKNGVIRSRVAFEFFSHWHQRRLLQAGEYLFEGPMTERQVFWKIANGRINVVSVKIPEGWNMFDIADQLERQKLCSRADFLRVARDPTPILDIAPHARSLEGFLFPSTYLFGRHTPPDQIAATMVREFRRVWNNLNPDLAIATATTPSLEDTVTLASLVERETPLESERPLVAGVFYNRLHRNYPLQCDPTVQYALALAGRPTQIVRHADLRVDSPYNTYLRPGLPPGPIANPGEASLRAAIDPAKTDFMYFVANDTGGHFFSKTLEEHNRNVAKYRRRLESDANGDSQKRAFATNPREHRSQP